MFGLSLAKLAVLFGVIGAIIAGFRYAGRLKAFQARMEKSRAQEQAADARRQAVTPKAPAKSVDMKQCPGCGTYIAAGSTTCGRAGCGAGVI